MNILGKVLLVLVTLDVAIALALVWTGVMLGAASAWVFHTPFHVGWRAVFYRKIFALLWLMVFGGASATTRNVK